VEGNLVEKDALAIAERLAEYDPNLYVICLDPEEAGINDAPFIIAEMCEDGQLRRIFEAWKLDNQVLDRVMAADTSKYDMLTQIDKINARAKKNAQQRYEEMMLENHDIAFHVMKNKKSSYTIPNSEGGISKIYDDRPAERLS
jgi:hypothetical protein